MVPFFDQAQVGCVTPHHVTTKNKKQLKKAVISPKKCAHQSSQRQAEPDDFLRHISWEIVECILQTYLLSKDANEVSCDG